MKRRNSGDAESKGRALFSKPNHRHYLSVKTLILSPLSLTARCTKSGLKQITCPSGLAFDIDKQTCDWKGKVTNCDKLESKSHLQKKRNQSVKCGDGRSCRGFTTLYKNA